VRGLRPATERLGAGVLQQVRCPSGFPVELRIDAAGCAIMGLRRSGRSRGRTGRACPRSRRIFPKSFPKLPEDMRPLTKWPWLLVISRAEMELSESPLRQLRQSRASCIGISEQNALPPCVLCSKPR
jgi:hypothetical protein